MWKSMMVMIVCLAMMYGRVDSSADVIKTMSMNFGKALDVCKKEVIRLNNSIILILFTNNICKKMHNNTFYISSKCHCS